MRVMPPISKTTPQGWRACQDRRLWYSPSSQLGELCLRVYFLGMAFPLLSLGGFWEQTAPSTFLSLYKVSPPFSAGSPPSLLRPQHPHRSGGAEFSEGSSGDNSKSPENDRICFNLIVS